MPTRSGNSSLKDPELYEKLRADGASKEKAARISNAAARDGRSTVGARGGTAVAYEEWSVDEVRARARGLEIPRVARMRKRELIDALRSR